MRSILIALCLLLTILAPIADAQITNVQLNGSGKQASRSFQGAISRGNMIFRLAGRPWLRSGSTRTQTAFLIRRTDRLYMSFAQVDGPMQETDGPPDLDGLANGHIYFSSRVGIAPGALIMRFSNNGTSIQVPGTVMVLASPVYTISGRVTVPPGKSAQYIPIEASRGDHYNPGFWHGLTDASGNYMIQFDADTA